MMRHTAQRRRLKKIALWGATILLPRFSVGSKLPILLLGTISLGMTYLLSSVSTLGLILAVLYWILLFYLGYIILIYSI